MGLTLLKTRHSVNKLRKNRKNDQVVIIAIGGIRISHVKKEYIGKARNGNG